MGRGAKQFEGLRDPGFVQNLSSSKAVGGLSGSLQTGDGRVFSTGSVQTHEGQLFIAEEAGRLFVDLADSGTASFERRTQIGTSNL